jgi:hypothetical protein
MFELLNHAHVAEAIGHACTTWHTVRTIFPYRLIRS